MTEEEWNKYFVGHWNFSGEKQDKHLAMFPEELPKRIIKMFSFVDDYILDPFLGSGTTSLVARNLNRNSVGYEINPDSIPIIKEKIGVNQKDLLNEATFEFLKQDKPINNFEEEIQKLSYIFKDPHKFDKKIDPRKLQFGSKIDQNGSQREDYFTVKEVISPELLKMSNGLIVKLIGVKQDLSKNGSAVEYLTNKAKGKKVFLKYDNQKYDKENNLLCYVYLQNKTFINAHLLKEGLAFVDTDIEFKYKEKFADLVKTGVLQE
jgi:site-specific DNA-methyltransferase (adenine-specific)